MVGPGRSYSSYRGAVSILEVGISIPRQEREAQPLGDTAGLAWRKEQVHRKLCAWQE